MKITKVLSYFSRKIKSAISCTPNDSPISTTAACQDVQTGASSGARSFVGCRERTLTPAATTLPVTSCSWQTFNTSRMWSVAPAVPSIRPFSTINSTRLPNASDPYYQEPRQAPKRRYEAYGPPESSDNNGSDGTSDATGDHHKDLEAEIRRVSYENERQLEQIRQLQIDLDRQQKIATCLQASKSSRPAELKKQIALLAAEVHDKEQTIKRIGMKYKEVTADRRFITEILEAKLMLAESAKLMEMCDKEWKRMKGEVAQKEKQIARREKGLGMCWPFDGIDG